MRTALRLLVAAAAAALLTPTLALAPATPAAAASTVFTVGASGSGASPNWEYRWGCDGHGPGACSTVDGAVAVVIRVENRPQPAAPITVDYQVEDITAVHGVNYTGPTSGTITIPAYHPEDTWGMGLFGIPILDTGSEGAPDKTLRVRLTGSSVPGADLSDTAIGVVQSGGEVPRDCTLSRPDADSFSAGCTDRPAGSKWQAAVTCLEGFRGGTFFGPVVTGNGTSSATCAGTGFRFYYWEFFLLA